MGDYSEITERPGALVAPVQVARTYLRYGVARRYAAGRDVLEVACGPGPGLGYLASVAPRVVGGDYSVENLADATAHYGSRIPLVRFDAHALPFRDTSFDLVLLLEAVYFLRRPEDFVLEAHRVLRDDGLVIIGSVNPAWRDFGRSPLSTRYLDSRELAALLAARGFSVEVFGMFPTPTDPLSWALSMLRRTSNRLRLPWPAAARMALRRRIYGDWTTYPAELLRDQVVDEPLVPLPGDRRDRSFQVIYAIGAKASGDR